MNALITIERLILAGHIIPLTRSWGGYIEDVIERDDDGEEQRDDGFFLIEGIFKEIEACFQGKEFAGFEDSPDDNSVCLSRHRGSHEIAKNRNESIAFMELKAQGMSDGEMQSLAREVLELCRNGKLEIIWGE